MDYTNVRTSSDLQIEESVEHLRNTALLLHTKRSSRHNNCRIGGLMFDSIYLKFNSKQVFYPGFSKRNTTSVQAPILGKRVLLADKSAAAC